MAKQSPKAGDATGGPDNDNAVDSAIDEAADAAAVAAADAAAEATLGAGDPLAPDVGPVILPPAGPAPVPPPEPVGGGANLVLAAGAAEALGGRTPLNIQKGGPVLRKRYRVLSKDKLLGEVDAVDETEAIGAVVGALRLEKPENHIFRAVRA